MPAAPRELLLPPRTLTGRGAIAELLPECAAWGRTGLLVHGRSLRAGGLASLVASCPSGVSLRTWEHPGGEPTLDQLDDLLSTARFRRPDWVAGVGGGSTLDLAKACAGLLNAPLPPRAYHDGAPIPSSRVPFAAAPTTAGTGSEATTVCVLTNTERSVKKSFRHPSFLARLVVLDPALLATCPPHVVASAGMDALTQAIESFVSRHATRATDALALEALRSIRGSIEAVFADSTDPRAEDLLVGSYLAGLALANARLGLVHGLAHPLGALYRQPHGLVCALCLPPVLEFNRMAMGEKYARLSEAMGGDALAVSRGLLAALRLASPFAGQPLVQRNLIVTETLASGSTAANPRRVAPDDVLALLAELFAPEPTEGKRP
jgi:alcohol dehydrogenase class IV